MRVAPAYPRPTPAIIPPATATSASSISPVKVLTTRPPPRTQSAGASPRATESSRDGESMDGLDAVSQPAGCFRGTGFQPVFPAKDTGWKPVPRGCETAFSDAQRLPAMIMHARRIATAADAEMREGEPCPGPGTPAAGSGEPL